MINIRKKYGKNMELYLYFIRWNRRTLLYDYNNPSTCETDNKIIINY